MDPEPDPGRSDTPLAYAALRIGEPDLDPVRADLYDPVGPGFHVFAGFVSPTDAAYMARFWSRARPGMVASPPGALTAQVPAGYPNFSRGTDDNRFWHNFFWNPPVDELTYEVASQIQRLRNRVESRAPHFEVLAFNGRAVSFIVTVTRTGSVVAPHQDWMGERHDPVRTQASLVLSTRGQDYEAGGLGFESNQGQPVDISGLTRAGDLVLFRYNNTHWVDPVETGPGGAGFIRVLFPSADVVGGTGRWGALAYRGLGSMRQHLVESPAARRYLRPVYQSLRAKTGRAPTPG